LATLKMQNAYDLSLKPEGRSFLRIPVTHEHSFQ
jgi:hypothetical protein